jgi:hypothetical protein
MHHDVVVHVTLFSSEVVEPIGGVVVTTVHAVPFQASTSAILLFEEFSL